MKRDFFLIVFVLLIVIAMASGCVIGGGASASRHVTGTNGLTEIEHVRTLPFIAWGDAKQAIAGQKVSNTKTGNSIGQTGFAQETSATNVPGIMRAGGELIGEGAAAFLKAQGVGPVP